MYRYTGSNSAARKSSIVAQEPSWIPSSHQNIWKKDWTADDENVLPKTYKTKNGPFRAPCESWFSGSKIPKIRKVISGPTVVLDLGSDSMNVFFQLGNLRTKSTTRRKCTREFTNWAAKCAKHSKNSHHFSCEKNYWRKKMWSCPAGRIWRDYFSFLSRWFSQYLVSFNSFSHLIAILLSYWSKGNLVGVLLVMYWMPHIGFL